MNDATIWVGVALLSVLATIVSLRADMLSIKKPPTKPLARKLWAFFHANLP